MARHNENGKHLFWQLLKKAREDISIIEAVAEGIVGLFIAAILVVKGIVEIKSATEAVLDSILSALLFPVVHFVLRIFLQAPGEIIKEISESRGEHEMNINPKTVYPTILSFVGGFCVLLLVLLMVSIKIDFSKLGKEHKDATTLHGEDQKPVTPAQWYLKIKRIQYVSFPGSIMADQAPVFQLVAVVNGIVFKFPVGEMPFYANLSTSGMDLFEDEYPLQMAEKYDVWFEILTTRRGIAYFEGKIPVLMDSTNLMSAAKSKTDSFTLDKLSPINNETNEAGVFVPTSDAPVGSIKIFYEIKN